MTSMRVEKFISLPRQKNEDECRGGLLWRGGGPEGARRRMTSGASFEIAHEQLFGFGLFIGLSAGRSAAFPVGSSEEILDSGRLYVDWMAQKSGPKGDLVWIIDGLLILFDSRASIERWLANNFPFSMAARKLFVRVSGRASGASRENS